MSEGFFWTEENGYQLIRTDDETGEKEVVATGDSVESVMEKVDAVD